MTPEYFMVRDNSTMIQYRRSEIKPISTVPKHILYVSTFGSLRWGGQKSLYHLVTRLDKHKYRPFVLLPTDEDFAEALRLKDVGVVIRSMPSIKKFDPFALLSTVRFLIRLIEHFTIALIHTDGPRNTFYAGLAAKFKNRPLVWHVRSSEKDCYDGLLVPLCTKIILVANALRKRFTLTRNEKMFTTIYNGLDFKGFDEPVPSYPNIRFKYNLDDDVILIGSFARIDAMKGQHNLIKACAMFRNDFRFKLFLFGEIYDLDYYNTCIKTIDKLGLKEYIIFGNYQRDVASIIKEMDLVVLNSVYGEAFPRSIIEGMAAAKPVIATDVGGCGEAFEDGVSGFIVPPQNSSALADVIIKLGKNKQMRANVGNAARIRAKRMFTIEKNVKQTENIYHELLSGERNVFI